MESVNNPNFLDSQYPNLIDTKKFGYAASCDAMADAGTDTDFDVALRCRALTRIYAGCNSRDFAEEIDVGPTRWNNIELGGKLSKDIARHIYRRYPEVSLDWLYRGKGWAMSTTRSEEFLVAYRDEVTAARASEKGIKKKRRTG